MDAYTHASVGIDWDGIVLAQVQGQPAMAATVKKDPFKESQEQAALFEKLIKERSSGGSLFKLKLPEVDGAGLACP